MFMSHPVRREESGHNRGSLGKSAQNGNELLIHPQPDSRGSDCLTTEAEADDGRRQSRLTSYEFGFFVRGDTGEGASERG